MSFPKVHTCLGSRLQLGLILPGRIPCCIELLGCAYLTYFESRIKSEVDICGCYFTDPLVLPFVSDEDLAALSKPFNFDHIFDIDVSQYALFQYCRPLITSTIALVCWCFFFFFLYDGVTKK